MLVLCDVDPPRLLEHDLVRPMRVEVRERVSQSVVFSQQNDLEQSQLRVLVRADVTCGKVDGVRVFKSVSSSLTTVIAVLVTMTDECRVPG